MDSRERENEGGGRGKSGKHMRCQGGLGYEPLTPPSQGSRSGQNQSRSQSRSQRLDKQMIRVKVAGPVLQTPATLLTSIHNTN